MAPFTQVIKGALTQLGGDFKYISFSSYKFGHF
jgi:hypothetical protein